MKSSANDRIRVMHVLPNLEVGGMENGVVKIANRINRDLFEVSICCLSGAGPLQERLSPDVTVLNLGQEAGKAWSLPMRLKRVFEKEKVDIVHTHNSFTGIYGIIGGRLCGSSVIIHGEHGMIDYLHGYRRLLKKVICSLADKTVTVSEGLKEDAGATWGIPSNKIVVIPNGVDQERFTKKSVTSIQSNGRIIPKSENEVILGTVGRLSDQKNYRFLLDAVSEIARNNGNTRLLIAGGGPLKKDLEQRIDELHIGDRVHLLGEREDIPDILNFMDIFLFPAYRGEGMANCLLEAMSVGLPIVASDIKGNTEVVEDKVTGLLFPNNDRAAFIDRTTRLIENPQLRSSYGVAAMERIERMFSIDRMIRDYEELYLDAVSR